MKQNLKWQKHKHQELHATPKVPDHGLTLKDLEAKKYRRSDGSLNLDKLLKKIKVQLPEETLTQIEKAVRHRGREGYFGADYSLQATHETNEKLADRRAHLEALINGQNQYTVWREAHSTGLFKLLGDSEDITLAKRQQIRTQYGRTD